jgi:predicted amidohydrolase YtcJ
MMKLYRNAKIWDGVNAKPFKGYLLVDGARIADVGPGNAPDTPRIGESYDMRSALLLPGFIDTHVHLVHTGLDRSSLPLHSVSSIAELLELSRKRTSEADQTIFVATGFDETTIREKRFPNAAEFERAVDGKPFIIFRRDFHSAFLTRKAWMALLEEEAPSEDGIARGKQCYLAQTRLAARTPLEEKRRGVEDALRDALQKGVTTVHALEGGVFSTDEDVDLALDIASSRRAETTGPGNHAVADGWLPRIVVYDQTTDVEKVVRKGLPRIGGCLLVDGSFGSRTAALFDPYNDEDSNRGRLFFETETLSAFYERAFSEGLQVACHAEGDRAISSVLTILEGLSKKFDVPNLRPRIEHFELLGDELVKRASALGLASGMQPAFDHFWGGSNGMYESRLGRERARSMNRLKTLAKYGVVVGGGSDSPITPLDPLLGIFSAMNHSNPLEKLNLDEVLRLFTSNAAWLAFEENDKGTLEKGKLADFVVMDHDLFLMGEDVRANQAVKATFIGGEKVSGSL